MASFDDNDNDDWEDDSDENGDNKDDSDDCNHVDNYDDAKPKHIVWSYFSKYLLLRPTGHVSVFLMLQCYKHSIQHQYVVITTF